jgi:outer membrane lipoprotein-sorting protein
VKEKYRDFDKDVKNMVIDMTITTSRDGQVEVKRKIFKKGDEVRMDNDIIAGANPQPGAKETKSVLVYDGKEAWQITPSGKQQLPEEAKAQFQAESNWWDKLSQRAKVTGQEKVNGRDAYVLEISPSESDEGQQPARVWLDKKDLLMLQAENKTQDGKTLKWTFSDFKPVKRWQMPARTDMYIDGKLVTTSLIQSIEVDQEIPDSLFNPDKVKF